MNTIYIGSQKIFFWAYWFRSKKYILLQAKIEKLKI